MPENKIDFGELIASGYDSKTISNASKQSGAEVILNSPDYYQKAGFTPEQIGGITNAYDAYKRNEYVSITDRPKVIYGSPSIYGQILHPRTSSFMRDPLLNKDEISYIEAGYDVYGNQVKTPGQVADERGQYRTKDGQWANLGGEFWNWAGNGLLKLVDLKQAISMGSPLGMAENWIYQQLGFDEHPSELIHEQLQSLASSKVLQFDPYGIPYWQSFNPYENPKELKPQEFSYKGLFPDDFVDERNRALMMNPKGQQRSLYGPQDIKAKSWYGAIGRGIVDFATTFIPEFTSGLSGMADVNYSILGMQPENEWSYMKSIERGSTLYSDKTRHLRSVEGQAQKWYQGENLGYGIGDVVGQLAVTVATAGSFQAVGLSKWGAGLAARGLMSFYGAASWKETMVDMNMSAKEQAVMFPIFLGTTFAIESLVGGNIVENGLFGVTTKEYARKVGKEAVENGWKEVCKQYGVQTVQQLTRTQKIAGAKYVAKNFATKALSTEHMLGRSLATGYEEAREELFEQGLNDIETILHDYFVTLEDNTSKVGYVGENKTDATFNNYDTTKSMIGNFVTNVDLDQYGQSFVLGFFGGLSGGVFRGRNKSKANEDWMIESVLDGKEKQMIKTINRTDLLLDYVHTDGKRVLNEQDKIDGAPSMNDFAKKKIIQDIEYMVQLRDSLGLRSLEQMKKFADDKSLLKEAMQLGLISSKLNQEATKILSKEGVTEEEVKQAQEYQRQANEMSQKLKDNYLTEENKGGDTSKAYNDKLKKALVLKHLAEQNVNEMFKKAGKDVNKLSKEEQIQYKNAVTASAITLRASEIERNFSVYENYKQFPQKMEEMRNEKRKEINNVVNNINSNLEKFFTKADEKINTTRANVESFLSEFQSGKLKDKELDIRRNSLNKEISDLSSYIGDSVRDSSYYSEKHKQKIIDYDTIINGFISDSISKGINIDEYKAIELNPTKIDLDDLNSLEDFDQFIVDSEQKAINIDPNKNLYDTIDSKIDYLESVIDNKSPYNVVKEAYEDVQKLIDEAVQYNVIGNKAIDKIDQKYRSENDIPIDDDTYNYSMDRLAESTNRLDEFASIVNEYVGNKSALTRNYKVEEMRLRFQQWNHHISTFDKFGEVFGNDAAEINAIIKSMRERFTKENKWLTSKDIPDETLNELNKSLTRLADLFNAHAEQIFDNKDYLKHLTADIYFGDMGLGSMNGKNELGANIFDEPINLFNSVDDDHIDDFTIPSQARTKGRYYYKFMSMYLFNNLLAMGGVKTSAALDQYHEMQNAIKPTDKPTPSSFEQYTMEIQAVGLAIAAKKGYSDKLCDVYLEKVKDRVKGHSGLEKGYVKFARIKNYFNFTGFGGSGKTKNSVAKFITMYSRMTGKTSMNIQVVSFNTATTNQLFNEVSSTGHKTTKTQFNTMEQVNVDVDMIIIDESTLIDATEMDVLRKKIDASKNKPIIIAFGDNTQMSAQPTKYNDPTFYAGPTMNPLMNVYRTNVAPIIMVQEYFRKMIFVSSFDKETTKIPKLSKTVDEDGNWIGATWMPDSQSVINEANSRRDRDIALVVLTKADKDVVLSDPSNKLAAGQIFVASDFLKIRDESIQGLQRDEVYIAFDPSKQNFEAGEIGYTTTGRARNYVSIVGPTNDIDGNSNNIGASGFIGSKAKPMTEEEKKQASDALLSHIAGSYDKNNAGFEYPKEEKPVEKPEPKKAAEKPEDKKKVQKKVSGKKTKKASAPDPEEQQKIAKDRDGNEIVPGDFVLIGEVVQQITDIKGNIVETSAGNANAKDVSIFDPFEEENITYKSYDVDDSTVVNDFVGNAVVDVTNIDDKQKRVDRETYSYFSVNHIAVPVDISIGEVDKIKDHARKIKILNFNEAFAYITRNSEPAFEFEERLTTEWDGKDMKPVQKKVLVLKITDQMAGSFIQKYNSSLPNSEKLTQEEANVLYNAVASFFIIPQDSPVAERLYQRLNADTSGTLVTRLTIQGDFINKAPVISLDTQSPKKLKDLPNSKAFKEKADKLGYRTEYIWKVKGRESGAGKGIAYIRIHSPNGKVRDVKLTALTVAEYNQKGLGNGKDYHDILIGEMEAFRNSFGEKSPAEVNKEFKATKTYNFLAKNGLKQYVEKELKETDRANRISNIIALLNKKAFADNFIAYTNENLGDVSRPATLTAFNIGNPQQFAIIQEVVPKPDSDQILDQHVNLNDFNDSDPFPFEREEQSASQMRYDEATKLVAKILGDTIAEMSVRNIPKDSDFYNDLRNMVGSFTGIFTGKMIGLRTENGYTKGTSPRHEATHFVFKYFLSNGVKNQLYAEAKQKISSDTGKPANEISDNAAEEFIATTYGKSDGMISQPWYAKYPMINRFMQKMKMFFAQLGLYSFKINDLMNAMEDGFFANGNVELEESQSMLEGEDLNFDPDSMQTESEKIEPEDSPEVVGEAVTSRELKDNLGEPLYIKLKTWFAHSVVENNIIGIGGSTVVSEKDSIKIARNTWAQSYPDVSFDTVLTKIDGSTITVGEVVYGENLNIGIQLEGENVKILAAALFKNDITSNIFAKANIPQFTADSGIATSNIGKEGNKKTPQELAKGLLSLGMDNIRPDGWGTPRINFKSLQSDFYNMCVSGKDKRPTDIKGIINEIRIAVEKANQNQPSVKNMNRFIKYYDRIQKKYDSVPVSKKIVIDEFLNAVTSLLISQNISSMATAHAIVRNEKIEKIKTVTKNFNHMNGLKAEIKNRWNDAIISNGEVTQAANRRVRTSGEDKERDTMFAVYDGQIKFTDGQISPSNYSEFLKVGTNGIFTVSDEYISKLRQNDPTAIKTLLKVYEFLGIGSIFNTELFMNLLKDHSHQKFTEAYPGLKLEDTNVADTLGSHIAGMMNSTIIHRKSLDIYAIAMEAEEKVKHKEKKATENVNRFKELLTLYSRGEISFDDVKNCPFIKNKIKSADELFRGKEIPASVLNNAKAFDNFKTLGKVASGAGDTGTAEDTANDDQEKLRIFRPTDNFPFSELLAKIGWEYRVNNVDNRIVMPGGGTMSAIGIVSSLDMAREKALKDQTQVTKKENMLATLFDDDENIKEEKKRARINSIFLNEDVESAVVELNGLSQAKFGTNEISASDLFKIHLFSYVDGKKNGNITIPLSTFADSGRNFIVNINNVNGAKRKEMMVTAYENQINKAIKNYESNVEAWISLINQFDSRKDLEDKKGVLVPTLLKENFIGDNMTEGNIQRFVDAVSSFEEALYQRTNTPEGKQTYYEWSKIVAASNLENIGGKEVMKDTAFYQTENGFADTIDRNNDQIEYIPVRRFKVGQAGKFGIDREGPLSAKNMFNYMSKFGKPGLITNIQELSNKTTNYDYLYNQVDKIAERAWIDIVEGYGGDIPASMASEVVDGKIKLAEDFQTFIMETLLIGEEFMSTYITGVESVDTPENMSKYIKTVLTPGVRMTDNVALKENFKVMYISDVLGVGNDGNIANLMDGGEYVSSFAQRIKNHAVGGKFAATSSYSDKPLESSFNNASGKHIVAKSSSFTSTNAMVELSPVLRKMEQIMLSSTIVKGINFGSKYDELWSEGKSHNEIIDELVDIYMTEVYENKKLLYKPTIVWKMTPEANIKRGAARVNVGTIDEIFLMAGAGMTVLSDITPQDIAFIYNPETKIDETTRSKKTIQKTSICSWLDTNEQGGVRQKDTLNDIISKQNDLSLKKFENLVGVRLDTFIHGTTAEKTRDAKKLEVYMKKVARSGLEGQGTSATLAEMINHFSMNTPNVYESVMQVFVNQLANKYGHRRGVSGDRMVQQFGHQFMILVDPETGQKYNIAELNRIKRIEAARKGEPFQRMSFKDFVDAGYQPRSMGYMKHDDKGVHVGEVALTFKYFDFFGLKSGEQPADLCTIWKNDGSRIDLRYSDTLPEFSVMRGDLETKYYVKDGEYFNETKDGGIETITEQEYLRNLAFEIANNPEVYDYDNTVLMRDTQASFQDKLMMAKDSLLIQMDRVPYSTPGFTAVSEIVAFINEKITDSLGNERERLPNTVFINMRESLRDGSDNDGDTKAVFYKSIVSVSGSNGDVFYSFGSAKDTNDDNYDRLSNLYFDRITSILLDKKNIKSTFGITTTDHMKKAIENAHAEETKKNKKPYRQMSDWGAIIDIYQSNQNDSSSIGNFANSSNVFGELITMALQGYNVYRGPFVQTMEERIRAIEVFSQILNAATDGVKKSILGPMNIISEFTNIFSYFAMSGKIPAFLLNSEELTNKEVEFVPGATDWSNVYKFFNSPMMKKISKKVVAGRSLFESSFENNVFFTINTLLKNIEVNGNNFPEFEEELGKIDYSRFDLETLKKAKALKDSIEDTAENEKKIGRLTNIIINLENLRILKTLEGILPYSESIFMLSQINSMRQKVLSKTFERDSFIDQLSMVFGSDVKHNELGTGIYDVFYNTDGTLRDSKDFEKKYQEMFGKEYADVATEYYTQHAPEFVREDNDTRVLKKEGLVSYTGVYQDYIKRRYSAVDTIRYAYGLRYGVEYMKNILYEDAVGKELSFIEGDLIPDAQRTYFDDNRDNTYSNKKHRQDIRDGFAKGSINAAFEYREELKNVRFGFRFKPEGVTAFTDGVDWTSGGNMMIMENQRDRNRFLLAFPSLIRNIKEAIKFGKLAKIEETIQYLLDIPTTEEGIAEAKAIAKALENNSFLNKISDGSGATPVIQYLTGSNTEENAAFLVEEKMAFMKLPEKLRNMFVAYNLLHYGYRQSKSFLEVVGTSNNYYEEVDKFRDETLEDWKANDPEMYESFQRQTLDQIYANKTMISAGIELAGRNVHKRAYLHKRHLSIAGKTVVNGLKVETAMFKNDNDNDYTAHFSAMPTIGAEYSYNGKNNLSQSELFAMTLKISMRELDTLLKTGELIIPNRINTFDSSDEDGNGIVYLVHGYTCISDPNHRQSGTMRLELSDNRFYQNKNAIVNFEKIDGTMLQSDRYNHYLKTAKEPARLLFKTFKGQSPTYPETIADSVVVHDASFDGRMGYMNGYQFTNAIYKKNGLTIPVELASSPRGFGFGIKDTSEDLPKVVIEENEKYNSDKDKELQAKIDQVLSAMRSAKAAGKTIVMPIEGIGQSLRSSRPTMFESFSQKLLDEFGYLNRGFEDQKNITKGLRMQVFDKMNSGRSAVKAMEQYVKSKGSEIPGPIESMVSDIMESFPPDRYKSDSNEARIKDTVEYIKGMLYDFKKNPVSLKERIENEENKCK
jgi:hypothetical protein